MNRMLTDEGPDLATGKAPSRETFGFDLIAVLEDVSQERWHSQAAQLLDLCAMTVHTPPLEAIALDKGRNPWIRTAILTAFVSRELSLTSTTWDALVRMLKSDPALVSTQRDVLGALTCLVSTSDQHDRWRGLFEPLGPEIWREVFDYGHNYQPVVARPSVFDIVEQWLFRSDPAEDAPDSQEPDTRSLSLYKRIVHAEHGLGETNRTLFEEAASHDDLWLIYKGMQWLLRQDGTLTEARLQACRELNRPLFSQLVLEVDARAGNPEAIDMLLKIVRSDSHVVVRAHALRCLRLSGHRPCHWVAICRMALREDGKLYRGYFEPLASEAAVGLAYDRRIDGTVAFALLSEAALKRTSDDMGWVLDCALSSWFDHEDIAYVQMKFYEDYLRGRSDSVSHQGMSHS